MNPRNLLLLYLLSTAYCLMQGTYAQSSPTDKLEVTREKSFRIPFRVDPLEKPRLREVQLYVSEDRGRQWRHYASTSPDQESFRFTSREDGEYWFCVRTLDLEGRHYPAELGTIVPGLRVLIDTSSPEISLRSSDALGNQIRIEWNITGEELVLHSMRLEFRRAGTNDWQPLALVPQPSGQASWEAGATGVYEVRLRIRDRSGNEGSERITVEVPKIVATHRTLPAVGQSPYSFVPGSRNPGFYGPRVPSIVPDRPSISPLRETSLARDPEPLARFQAPPRTSQPPSFSQSPQTSNPPYSFSGRSVSGPPYTVSGQRSASGLQPTAYSLQPTSKLVNSTRFGLRYEVEELGKSGLGSVDLYYTYDGRTWEHYGQDSDRQSPFMVKVNGEGTYGFSLIAKNGAGVGDDPPATGDLPQTWIEVDITPPEITLYPPAPGHGPTEGILYISWHVGDRNLDPKTIRLSFAERAGGPWETIAENIEDTGRYQWRMPESVPFKFYVLLEARDRAGNIGRAQCQRPVIVDLSRPRPKILGVESSDPLSVISQ